MHYTEQDVEKLVKAVEAEFTSHLAKAEEKFKMAKSESVSASLAKAEDGEKKPEKKPEGEEKKDSAPPQEAKPEGEPKPEGEAAPAEGEAKPAPGEVPMPPGDGQAAQGGHGYDADDLAHMDKMYMSMSRDELMAHHDSVRKALDAGAGAQAPAPGAAPAAPGLAKDESITASAPKGPLGARSEASKEQGPYAKEGLKKDELIKPSEPKGSPGAKDAASDAHGDKINVGLKKTEHARENGGKIEGSEPKGSPGAKAPATKEQDKVGKEVSMEKSENQQVELLKAELAEQKAKSEGLQKNLDGVSAFITKLLERKGAPQGKAITSLEQIAKSEGVNEGKDLSKVEIDTILNKKAQDPKLEKSDRDAINNYCLNGKTDIDSIRHLLK